MHNMDEQNNLVTRERTAAGGSLDTLPARAPFLTLDMMPREPHLLDYLMVLRKHQWLVLSFLVTVVTVVTIATYRMQPIYDATTRIQIDQDQNNILPFSSTDSYNIENDLEVYIETQSKILTSQTLAAATVKSLQLDHNPAFGGHPVNPNTLEEAKPDDGLESPALGAFLGNLSVKRVPNSRLLDVTFSATDPQLAAKAVNTHIQNFIEQNFRSRYEATTQASNWLAGQLDELKAKMERSEDARIEYERQNQIWTIDEKEDVTTQKLADLNHELTGAQTDRIGKEAVYQSAQSGNYDAIPAVRESSVIQDIEKQQSALDAQYAEAMAQYGPKLPKVVRLQEQMKQLNDVVTQEKINIANEVEAEYQGARQRELLLNQALDDQKKEAGAMADRMVEYNILKRDADANKQLYDGLQQKLKEAGISAGLRSSNIRVVDPALVPKYPSKPQKSRNLSLAILVGLVGGIGLALLREYLDNTVKNPDDIENLARLPSLAVVPAFANPNGHSSRSRLPKLLKGQGSAAREGRVELVSHLQPQSGKFPRPFARSVPLCFSHKPTIRPR